MIENFENLSSFLLGTIYLNINKSVTVYFALFVLITFTTKLNICQLLEGPSAVIIANQMFRLLEN